MSDPATAREALLIDAIGEAAYLIQSVGRLTPEIQNMTREIDRASAGLRDSLAGFEAQVLALTEKAKVQAVRHIVARTDEVTRRTLDAQTRAMAEAAQLLFKAEIGPTLQRLAMPLQRILQRIDRRWDHWLTHAATAAVASTVTWVLAAEVLTR